MPGFVLLTFWSLIVPSIVIGGVGALESFGHSWRTVRGTPGTPGYGAPDLPGYAPEAPGYGQPAD